ncbi:MAG: tetratricopeptide repeat protein [Planctomycetota bacterium]
MTAEDRPKPGQHESDQSEPDVSDQEKSGSVDPDSTSDHAISSESGSSFDEPTMPLGAPAPDETLPPSATRIEGAASISKGAVTSGASKPGSSKPGSSKPGSSKPGSVKPSVGRSNPNRPEAGATSGQQGNASGDPSDQVRYFGDYELLDEIARGGMGVVFKARQVNLNRIVALKMILAGQFAGEEDVQRFYTEAEAAAQLDHPGIVPIFEIGEHDDQRYYSMGYIEGQSLAQRIADETPAPNEAAELTRKICDAISYAHDRNVIHRDLKPANILLDASGQPKVTDFGLAKKTEADSNLTGTGQILGTPAYMPPEQASGNVEAVGRPADIYSLGAILYCLLTGRPPFQASSPMDTLMQVLKKEPTAPRQLVPSIPVDLETICLKCLEKEPSRRYDTAASLSEDLGRYLNDEPIEARPSSAAYKFWRKAKRNRTTSLALVAAFVAVLGGGIFFFQSRETANRERAAQQSAKGAQEALQRVQSAQGIQQLAIIPFRNLSGNPAEDWLGAGFASVLQTKLSASDSLKVVGKGPMEEAAAALGIPANEPMDESDSLRFGRQLVVNHVITGEFQRIAEQIQVSARLINTQTGAIDRGGMQVRGDFADVFELQTDLANQCLAQLGVIEASDETPKVEASGYGTAAAPAASVDAWMFLGQGQQSLANGDYDQAIRLCTRAIEEDPKLWKAYRTKGIAHTKIDEIEESLQAFQSSLEVNPEDWTSNAYFNLLSGRMVEGFAAMDKAEAVGDADLDLLKFSTEIGITVVATTGGEIELDKLTTAIESHPDDQELLVLLASAQTAKGETDAAIETLEAAVDLKPRRPAAHLLLSLAYETQGRMEEAKQELAEAERYRAEGIRGFREFGDLYAKAGKKRRAIAEFQKALDLDPDDSSSHLELGELYLVSDILKALGHYETALVQRPDSLQVLSVLCRLFNLIGQNSKLEQYASRWVDADPNSYEAHQYLRLAYLKTGQVAQAESELAALDGLTPRHKTFFVMTGNTLIQTSLTAPQMIDEAILVLRKGTEAYPEDTVLSGMLAFTEALKLWLQRQWQPASEQFERLLTVFDGGDLMSQAFRRDSSTFLASCYEQLDRIPEAAEQMRVASTITPELVIVPKTFSLFEKAQRYDYAIEFAKTLAAIRPNDLQLHRNLIRSYAFAGQWNEAKQYFSKLPSNTTDDLIRQIHVGVALAEWLERRGQTPAGSAQQAIERLLKKTIASSKDEEGSERLEAHARWARFPQHMLVLGPFEGLGGLVQPLAPEEGFDPNASFPGQVSALSPRRDVTWRLKSGRAGDRVDLQAFNPDQKELIVYCSTFLQSPVEQSVTLIFAGSDQAKVWMNGQELDLSRRANGEVKANVTLQKGANRLLIKTIDLPPLGPLAVDGPWNLSIDAIDSNGWPAKVRWSSDADAAVGEARALVSNLESRLLLKQDVIDELNMDSSLAESKRAAAILIAKQLPEDGERINVQRIREFLGDGMRSRRAETAVRVTGAACRANPSSHECFGALALACYTTERFETATKAANRALELCRQDLPDSHPVYLSILAMSHHRLAQDDKAKEAYQRLKESVEKMPGNATAEKALKEATTTLKSEV